MGLFESPGAYDAYLLAQHARGALPAETLTGGERGDLLYNVLDPEPLSGFYTEIGPASEPYFTGSIRPFSGTVRYLGIDGGRSDYYPDAVQQLPALSCWTEYGRPRAQGNMHAAASALAADRRGPFASLVWADAQHLPFPNHSPATPPIHETFMRDVLVRPGMHPRSMEALLQEQVRTLHPEGWLVIREAVGEDSLSPMQAEFGSANPRFLALVAGLQRTGFTRRAVVLDTDVTFKALRAQFPGSDDQQPTTKGYYLICQQEPATPHKTASVLATWRTRATSRIGGWASEAATRLTGRS